MEKINSQKSSPYSDSQYFFVHFKLCSNDLKKISVQQLLTSKQIIELFGNEYKDWEHYFILPRDKTTILLRKKKF